MAKKRRKAAPRRGARREEVHHRESPFGKYREHFISATEDFVAREMGNVVDWLKGLTHVRTKFRKLFVHLSLSAAGTTLLLYGVTRLLMDYFPNVRDGALYLVVGAAAILTGSVYKRL
jgi:hypothetical protein